MSSSKSTAFHRHAPLRVRRLGVLLVLIILPLTGCVTGNTSSDESTASVAALRLRHQQIDQIVAALRPHGLVYDLNKQVKVGGKSVTLKLLAVDRDASYLEFGEDQSPGLMFDLLDASDPGEADGPHPVADPATVFTEFNASPSPNATTLIVQARTFNGKPTSAGRIQVPVDLSALAQLPRMQQPSGTVTKNGIRLEIVAYRRGYAETDIDLYGAIMNAKELSLRAAPQSLALNSTPSPTIVTDGAWSLNVTDDAGTRIQFSIGSSQISSDGWRATVQLSNVPASGHVTFHIDSLYTKDLAGNTLDGTNGETVAQGPWDLTIAISQSP